jgi:hypothetical protein
VWYRRRSVVLSYPFPAVWVCLFPAGLSFHCPAGWLLCVQGKGWKSYSFY